MPINLSFIDRLKPTPNGFERIFSVRNFEQNVSTFRRLINAVANAIGSSVQRPEDLQDLFSALMVHIDQSPGQKDAMDTAMRAIVKCTESERRVPESMEAREILERFRSLYQSAEEGTNQIRAGGSFFPEEMAIRNVMAYYGYSQGPDRISAEEVSARRLESLVDDMRKIDNECNGLLENEYPDVGEVGAAVQMLLLLPSDFAIQGTDRVQQDVLFALGKDWRTAAETFAKECAASVARILALVLRSAFLFLLSGPNSMRSVKTFLSALQEAPKRVEDVVRERLDSIQKCRAAWASGNLAREGPRIVDDYCSSEGKDIAKDVNKLLRNLKVPVAERGAGGSSAASPSNPMAYWAAMPRPGPWGFGWGGGGYDFNANLYTTQLGMNSPDLMARMQEFPDVAGTSGMLGLSHQHPIFGGGPAAPQYQYGFGGLQLGTGGGIGIGLQSLGYPNLMPDFMNELPRPNGYPQNPGQSWTAGQGMLGGMQQLGLFGPLVNLHAYSDTSSSSDSDSSTDSESSRERRKRRKKRKQSKKSKKSSSRSKKSSKKESKKEGGGGVEVPPPL